MKKVTTPVSKKRAGLAKDTLDFPLDRLARNAPAKKPAPFKLPPFDATVGDSPSFNASDLGGLPFRQPAAKAPVTRKPSAKPAKKPAAKAPVTRKPVAKSKSRK